MNATRPVYSLWPRIAARLRFTPSWTVAFVLIALGGAAVPLKAEEPPPRWKPDAQTLEEYARKRSDVLVREALVPDFELPAVLDAETLAVAADDHLEAWQARRQVLLGEFEQHVYGEMLPTPDKVTVTTVAQTPLDAVDGGVCRRQRLTATLPGGEFTFDYLLYGVEGERRGVFVMINNRAMPLDDPGSESLGEFVPFQQVLEAGFALAVFHHSDVAPDNGHQYREGVLKLVLPEGPRAADAPGAIAAWSWGASRVLDSLADSPFVDIERAAIIGHSRGGKTALWTGACDTRFSLVISNNSGCGGAALSRRHFGETVAVITRDDRFGYWFCPQFAQYGDDESQLPVDQHQLIALVAPRHVYVASADRDLWADPHGEWLGLVQAHTAFTFCGLPCLNPNDAMPAIDQPVVRGATSYHIRTGVHNLTPWDWQQYLKTAGIIWQTD